MNARFLPEVEAEVRAAAQWYEDRQAGLSDRFLNAVLEAQLDIETHPMRFPSLPGIRTARPVRRRLLKAFPYAMIYEVRDTEILVVAVAHNRRKPGYWRKRGI